MTKNVNLDALASEEGIEIVPGVRVRLRSLADYRQNPENPVSHTSRNLGAVIESIHKVGAARSGFSSKGKIIAGNLTSEAMADAGIEGVVEVTTDGTRWVMVNREDLTPEQEKQAAYGDQQSSFLAGWELDQVLADVEAGVDLSGLVSDFELEAILGEALVEVEMGEAPEAQMDRASELQDFWQVQRGQIWEIPSKTIERQAHRLMCGDSTSAEDIARLMVGKRAKLMATDPPYGDAWVQKARDMHERGYGHSRAVTRAAIQADDLSEDELQDFLLAWLNIAVEEALKPPAPVYVWHRAKRIQFELALIEAGFHVHQPVIWVKPSFVIGRLHYHPRCEWALHGWLKGNGRPPFYGERNQSDVWEVDREDGWEHPTQKPLLLFEKPIANHLKHGEVAYEPFTGSGTQFVAAERWGVLCYGNEIREEYCSITLERLKDMGLEPKLLE